MGGKESKEENTAEVHGNQLMTVITSQNEHSEEHSEHKTLLIIVICLLVTIIIGQVIRLALQCLRKKYMKKGIKTAESLASIAHV